MRAISKLTHFYRVLGATGQKASVRVLSGQNWLILESFVLADKLVRLHGEEVLVTEAEGAGEQSTNLSVDAFYFSTWSARFCRS
jgi:hypothetical protein